MADKRPSNRHVSALIGNHAYFPPSRNDNYWVCPILPPNKTVEVKIKNYDRIICELLRKKPRLAAKDLIANYAWREPMLTVVYTPKQFTMFSLLWIAVLGCYDESLQLLVHFGADVNEPFGIHNPQLVDEKWTILQVLLQMENTKENEELINLVIQHGADLDVCDSKGESLLHLAVLQMRALETETLLKKGVNVNVRDVNGRTPLLAAACNAGSHILIPLLIQYKADVKARDNYGSNALSCLSHLASGRISTYINLAKFMVSRGVEIDDKDCYSNYELMRGSIMYGSFDTVKFFLEHGADANARGPDGQFPLYHAVQKSGHNTIPMILMLLKHGAKIQQKTDDGCTALHAACENEKHCFCPKDTMIKLLLRAGADLFAEDNNGHTPFSLLNYDSILDMSSIFMLIKLIALKRVIEPFKPLKDEKVIEKIPELQKFYERCIVVCLRMENTKFIETCSFLQLLTENHCKIAELMRNVNFEPNFKSHDVRRDFFVYAEAIEEAFANAKIHYDAMIDHEKIFIEATYDIFPYEIVRKVVQNLTFTDCCDFQWRSVIM